MGRRPEGGGETKSRLITAALVAAPAVSVVSGAGAAGASTGTGAELCTDQTSAYQANYQHYPLTIPCTDGWTVKYVLQVTTHKSFARRAMLLDRAFFAPNGTCKASTSMVGCVAPGKGAPADATGSVTSIRLPTGQSWHMGAEQYRQLRAWARHHRLGAGA